YMNTRPLVWAEMPPVLNRLSRITVCPQALAANPAATPATRRSLFMVPFIPLPAQTLGVHRSGLTTPPFSSRHRQGASPILAKAEHFLAFIVRPEDFSGAQS